MWRASIKTTSNKDADIKFTRVKSTRDSASSLILDARYLIGKLHYIITRLLFILIKALTKGSSHVRTSSSKTSVFARDKKDLLHVLNLPLDG